MVRLVVGLSLACLACGSSTEPLFGPRLATGVESITIAPLEALVNQPVTVDFVVINSPCVKDLDPEVSINGLEAVIRPMVFVPETASGGCVASARLDRHRVELRFATAGTAQIVFVGANVFRKMTINPMP